MKLQELAGLFAVHRLIGDAGVEIQGIQADSRKVKPGDLFICVRGLVSDGHQYAAAAVEAGASALVVEEALPLAVPMLVVKDARHALAAIAACFNGYPSSRLKVIGVTGTNGKTTSTYIMEKILSDQGYVTGLMGNIEMRIGATSYPTGSTNTREPLELHESLRKMADAGVQYCLMEASSHALDLGRVKETRFRTALFTNLTQDHLDYHKTMENYRQAKGLLFSRLGNGGVSDAGERSYAVLNADDPASAYFASQTAVEVITYGVEQAADVSARDIRITAQGTFFRLVTWLGEADVKLRLVGKFNVYNTLGAVAVCLLEGVSLEQAIKSLESIPPVEGRMEAVGEGQEFQVLVDYAHTPDGLENALAAVKEVTEGRVITVFGCGGDRDRTKRPIMGKIAARFSDYVFVTSDNPRSENPEAILRDIEPGVLEAGFAAENYQLIADRREAIQKAIEMASPKDVVLIAGKGHETYQIINGATHHFDDREEARAALRSRKH
ncbi:UDP-N-acetylmuramoyl-L-alanyl-D-glutamate--2,6-diaminopimelate ligase [Paenibacillus sp. YN15]|uniref:UDP-N-acetylmuramoyl-L-alanyl-D-glutamate--2, 6-diaminopimelate ligase n=1 Tax=Paenibacillus sp. YN15 TaxID=1742774 RepID=UPI000DCBCB6A|nr:UDP-N-acetylmuramoyl-L-alanyl-D-glutamate--2,6-diaminopimelate ligase [Paenibacillus sp. YN15]RAU99162.1 UDP-N-acetylmuramoyl-L-alanyl-D-glutamate--2,6-diaminopimelate ligase [Paenibacillus sp. YN15]